MPSTLGSTGLARGCDQRVHFCHAYSNRTRRSSSTYVRIKRFRINLLIFVRELPCLLNPDHPAARPGPCPRRRRPVHRDVSLLHAANEPGVRGGGTTATTPEAEGEPGHHQLLQSLLEGTYIPDLPPSITSSRINVRLAGSDLTQETSLSSVLQLPLAL